MKPTGAINSFTVIETRFARYRKKWLDAYGLQREFKSLAKKWV